MGFGAGLVEESVSLIDAAIEYLVSRLRLEEYRLELRGRAFLLRATVLACAVAVGVLGLIFVSVGAAAAISDGLQSRPAGPAIVGGVYLLVGGIVIVVASRGWSGKTGKN